MSSLARSSSHKRQQASNDVDRISNLPESVLSHILSFLPTEEAVATSFLSTRWKFLWKNIHHLFFSDYIIRQFSRRVTKDWNIKFAHFVSKVLLFLNQQSIDKFSLRIIEYYVDYDVTTWIAAAVARQVKVLEFCSTTLFSPSDPRIQLPCSLLTCKTLEFLNLDGVMNLNDPTLVCLPNLKTLYLKKVIFQCDESFRNLVSGCSSLQTLYIVRDAYDNVVNFTISSPTLTNLTFHFYEDDGFFPEDDYKLEINAPALTWLYLRDHLSKDFSVESLRSLDEADIELYFARQLTEYDHYSKAVVKLLRGVYNVKEVYLRTDAFEALSHAGVLPSFWRLT